MASLTTAISVQVDANDKEKATEILQKLGVSMSGLINMTLKQVIMMGGIPFDIKLPKKNKREEVKSVLEELEYIEKNLDKYPRYDNWEDLKSALLEDE